jgi:hypothetical protein
MFLALRNYPESLAKNSTPVATPRFQPEIRFMGRIGSLDLDLRVVEKDLFFFTRLMIWEDP